MTVIAMPPSTRTPQSYEALKTRCCFQEGAVHLVVLYRPLPSPENRLTVDTFIDEFGELLARHAGVSGNLIFTREFHFHYEDLNNPSTVKCQEFLRAYNMVQHVRKTHTRQGPHAGLLHITAEDTCGGCV